MKNNFIQLPKIIEAYFIAAGNYDQTGLAKCFAEDIELIDEGEKYSGPSAVSHHIVEASQSVNVTTTINAYEEKNERKIVTATITGNFQGSPIPLDYHFKLVENKISELKILDSNT